MSELEGRLPEPGPAASSAASLPLSPHFLFNALNTIRYFVRTNTSAARDMLLDLSTVLQSALRTEGRAPLRDEIESGRAYLRLECARLGSRLQVTDQINVEEADLLVASRVLGRLLQALVGALAARSEGGTVSLSLCDRVVVLEADGQAEFPALLLSELGDTISVSRDQSTRVEWRTQP